MAFLDKMYNFSDTTVVMTGGTGVLGKCLVAALAGSGANVALIGRNEPKARALAESFGNGRCVAFKADVMDKHALEEASAAILKRFGKIDALVNGAGGNSPQATTNPQQSFFQLDGESLKNVSDLNLLGTIFPSQVFGQVMAQQKKGIILNIASMAGFRPLTRVVGYSAAKAAVANFTQWFAVHMAQEYSPNIRVNAIAPGFFLTEQNRFLLTDKETGNLTERGKKILGHTPMGRFGDPEDLVGAFLWLLSPASAFVTGVVVPIDGGFSAYSGV